MRARCILLSLGVFLSGCAAASGEGAALPTASASASPTHKVTSAETLGPSPSASPSVLRLAADQFAAVVTDDLVVRSAPGTADDSDVYGTVANLAVYVLDGPVQADSYEWWLIVPLDAFACCEQPPAGWVAAGTQGEVWLAPTRRSCDDAPTSDALWGMSSVVLVGCYGAAELTLEGTLGGCANLAGWENYCSLRNCPPSGCGSMVDDRAFAVHFDALPAQTDGLVTLTGHFDDPTAGHCGISGDPLWRLQVFQCRIHFFATSYHFAE